MDASSVDNRLNNEWDQNKLQNPSTNNPETTSPLSAISQIASNTFNDRTSAKNTDASETNPVTNEKKTKGLWIDVNASRRVRPQSPDTPDESSLGSSIKEFIFAISIVSITGLMAIALIKVVNSPLARKFLKL